MNRRERASTALSGGVPDMVPLGDFAIDYDIAERILGHETYHRAKARCQIAYWEGRRDEVVQSLIEDTIALYRKLDIYDIVNLCSVTLNLVPPRGYRPEAPRKIDDATWEYADGRVQKYSPLTGDITEIHDPARWTRPLNADDYPLIAPDVPPDPSVYEVADAVTAALGGDRFVIGPYPRANEWVQPGGMERSLVEMVDRPDLVQRALESSLVVAAAEQAAWQPHGYDATMDSTDWAYRSGPFISPRLWRRFCYPALEANVRAAHQAGLLFVQHACGNNWPILGDMMRAGVDCYQSIQASADMDLPRVREATRGRMALWGGVQVEHLVSGTPEEVREDVRSALAVGRQGAFVLGATHSISVGTSYDNYMAMLDEFDRGRRI